MLNFSICCCKPLVCSPPEGIKVGMLATFGEGNFVVELDGVKVGESKLNFFFSSRPIFEPIDADVSEVLGRVAIPSLAGAGAIEFDGVKTFSDATLAITGLVLVFRTGSVSCLKAHLSSCLQ